MQLITSEENDSYYRLVSFFGVRLFNFIQFGFGVFKFSLLHTLPEKTMRGKKMLSYLMVLLPFIRSNGVGNYYKILSMRGCKTCSADCFVLEGRIEDDVPIKVRVIDKC